MSIQTEIELLQNTKENNRVAIMEKGVNVYDGDPYSVYPTKIGLISSTPGDKDSLMRALVERNVTSIVIPDTVTRIRPSCFTSCTSLISVEIPNSVKYISQTAFSHCTSLTTVTIPESVISIGNYAFYYCTGLQSITCLGTIPPTLGSDNNAFNMTNNCPIYVPSDSVDAYKTAWSRYADRIQAKGSTPVTVFKAVTSVDEVTSGKYILGYGYGIYTFFDGEYNKALNASLIKDTTSSSDGINGSTNTINVNFTDNETIYPDNLFNYVVFDYDSDTQKIYWTDTNDNNTRYYMFQPSNRVAYFGTPTTTVPSTNITVTTNGSDNEFITFSSSRLLNDDGNGNKIGWYLKSSNDNCFTLFKMTEVVPVKKGTFTLTNNSTVDVLDYSGNSSSLAITTFDAAQKYNLTLRSAELNDKVTTIGDIAFYSCTALESVIIPNTVTDIYTYAFNGCTGLQSVTCLATTPPTLAGDAFINTNNCPIYVPAASVDTYKAAPGWSDYASRIQAISS